MTTQIVIDIANRINQIDGRVSSNAEGSFITGTFRGKGSENYKYNVATREFIFNNEGPSVRKAVEAAVKEFEGKF